MLYIYIYWTWWHTFGDNKMAQWVRALVAKPEAWVPPPGESHIPRAAPWPAHAHHGMLTHACTSKINKYIGRTEEQQTASWWWPDVCPSGCRDGSPLLSWCSSFREGCKTVGAGRFSGCKNVLWDGFSLSLLSEDYAWGGKWQVEWAARQLIAD